jgi:hypothetical protein
MLAGDDTFRLYDLPVQLVATDHPIVCNHRPGEVTLVPLREG